MRDELYIKPPHIVTFSFKNSNACSTYLDKAVMEKEANEGRRELGSSLMNSGHHLGDNLLNTGATRSVKSGM